MCTHPPLLQHLGSSSIAAAAAPLSPGQPSERYTGHLGRMSQWVTVCCFAARCRASLTNKQTRPHQAIEPRCIVCQVSLTNTPLGLCLRYSCSGNYLEGRVPVFSCEKQPRHIDAPDHLQGFRFWDKPSAPAVNLLTVHRVTEGPRLNHRAVEKHPFKMIFCHQSTDIRKSEKVESGACLLPNCVRHPSSAVQVWGLKGSLSPHTYTRARAHKCTQIHTHTQMHTHAHAHARARTHTNQQTHCCWCITAAAPTHSHNDTHTGLLAPPPQVSPPPTTPNTTHLCRLPCDRL